MTDLIQRLREWHCHDCMVQDLTNEAADELERLTRGWNACKHAFIEQGKEVVRLTRERDEAIKYRDYEFALRDALANENARLRAALKRIIHEHEHESFDAATTVARMYYVAREAFKGEK